MTNDEKEENGIKGPPNQAGEIKLFTLPVEGKRKKEENGV